jgi:hypothetical protein
LFRAAGRATWPFAQRWTAQVYGDVGAGDSDLTWQISAMLGLHFEGWGLGFGYRVLDYDFEDGSDELDLTGPSRSCWRTRTSPARTATRSRA